MRISRTNTSNIPAPLALPGSKASRVLARCLSYLRPYWRMTLGAYLTLVGINALTLAIPQFIRWIVDRGIGSKDTTLLTESVMALLLLTLVKGALTFWQGRWTEQASQSVAYDLRNALHRKFGELSFSYHDRTHTGQLLSRTMQDVERVRFVTGRAFLRLVDSTVLMVGSAAILIWMNPRLALLALVMLPFLAHRALYLGRRLRPISLAVQQQLAVLTTRLEQNLRGARVVKVFAQEDAEVERFDQENDHWFNLSVRASRMQAINTPLMDFIANISTVIIIWYGGRLVVQGQLTLGELVAFMTYLAQLASPVRRMGQVIPALAIASAAGARVFEILDTQSEVRDTPDAIPLPSVRGAVRFEHVSFAYAGRLSVLDDISFEAKPGQVIALIGMTGSGKSTVINLIPRFYDVTAGRITIDGYDIRDVTLSSLRDQIGHGAPGHAAVRDDHSGEYRVRSPGSGHGRDYRGCAGGAGSRFYHCAAGGLRDGSRRARYDVVGRPAPARCDCARAAQRSAHLDPRRCDGERGHRDRTADSAGAGTTDARAHVVHYRATALDAAHGGCRSGAGPWADCHARHTRSVAPHIRTLRGDVSAATTRKG